MKMMTLSSLLMAAALLAGCTPKAPKTIYYWGDYQEQIYSYYQQSGDPLKQIDALNLDVEKARAAGQPVPPGLHAQLGLLYAKTGDTNKAFGQFATEKQLFSESAPYMDFLMSKKQGVVQ
ncbi:DUF4810 domain-containing protein [Pantoea agglomerans]|uniref:DUF4810 domain-containing protein n=1 Tax=unclassified Pantoea TaxID=2630326 RepID=UPI000BEF5C1E|nr:MULTISPECIES: DUF4810 domain-containing protein [Pantoea]PEI03542.1 DUF4810 domain-containing protein [Pantoea agglomerans]GME36186.1 DUF4810 domain-containing protein [Pantoea sp. QMID3]GME36284.1 DUF4810 domain-containing protein [Pantoea sp. QMID1]GME59271.1 DUF4810 domain-containing protein [Pantoea sp. QMID4]GME60798.1 DUF4810 domain-containing protein [Pantoea sp. QMID2]